MRAGNHFPQAHDPPLPAVATCSSCEKLRTEGSIFTVEIPAWHQANGRHSASDRPHLLPELVRFARPANTILEAAVFSEFEAAGAIPASGLSLSLRLVNDRVSRLR